MDSMLARVKKVVSQQLDINENIIQLDSYLIDDLGADSLDNVELILALEEEFDTEIDEAQAGRFFQVKNVLAYLESQTI